MVPLALEIWFLFVCLQKWPKLSFRPWTIVREDQKLESAQKIHASRGWCEMYGSQFWWAWLLWFWRYGYLSKMAKFPFRGMVIEKFNWSESVQKVHASRGWRHVHAHHFWWVWPLRFWRFGYLLKTAKFPFRGKDYSPSSSKNLIDRNRLKKYMQVEIDVTSMHTNFDGRGLSSLLMVHKVEKI